VNNLPKLVDGETVVNCLVPDTADPREYLGCVVCEAMAYRIIIIKGNAGTRSLPLCGVHFIGAAIQIPQLQRYMRLGKIG
jgi:hypothetical protein